MFTLSFHAGIAEDRLLGPYFLAPRLTGAVHHDCLRNFAPDLLQDVKLQTRTHLWFVHDGAAPHFLLAVRKFLSKVFPVQRMGGCGPTAWPACSPDLIPLISVSGHI